MANFLLTAIEEPSLWEEIWKYLEDKYFTIDYGNYQHLQMSNPVFSIRTLLICFWVGIVLAAALAIFNKRVLGDFVRACARDGATSPEKARTLSELGFLKNSSVRSALKRRGSLRRVVRCVEDDVADLAAGIPIREEIAALYPEVKADGTATKPGRTALDTARFYIPEAEIYTAEIRYDKKGTNWLAFFGTLVLGFVVVLLLIQLMPDILQLVDNFISMVNPSSNFVQ